MDLYYWFWRSKRARIIDLLMQNVINGVSFGALVCPGALDVRNFDDSLKIDRDESISGSVTTAVSIDIEVSSRTGIAGSTTFHTLPRLLDPGNFLGSVFSVKSYMSPLPQ